MQVVAEVSPTIAMTAVEAVAAVAAEAAVADIAVATGTLAARHYLRSGFSSTPSRQEIVRATIHAVTRNIMCILEIMRKQQNSSRPEEGRMCA